MQARERMRKHKFTEAELDVLIEEVTQKEDVLFGLQGNCMTTYEKNKIWVEIAHRLHATSGMHRTVSEIKRRWQDLKRRTKQKVEDARFHVSTTSPSSLLYLTAMEQRVYDSLNIQTVVKEEEQDIPRSSPHEVYRYLSRASFSLNDMAKKPSPYSHLSLCVRNTFPIIITGSEKSEESPLPQPSILQTQQCVESSQAPVLLKPHTYTEQYTEQSTSMPFTNHETHVVNQECDNIQSQSPEEPLGCLPHTEEALPTCETQQASFPGLRSPRRIQNSPNRIVSVGHFEQQLLRAHREHTAVVKEGFRALTRQNRLIYREMCETNKNIARIASRLAEKNESVSDLAEELAGIHHKITESIDTTNCLQDRVIDLLASQQERSVIVVPSAVKGTTLPSSSSAELPATAVFKHEID
ncbi:t-SNARE domain-containing protein 1-like isoform X1 [Acipenser oxyrinchus oxyrinchus]|uniref:t-SNARE domain-containing protein 1-like isoform X1 n=1 Tax=Acipenser oxyrinchus oxyrinchus TaxID=40147 RepID=A0AAD8DB79_ACIOX|nr:t-SNARE domain-containing protein 1-like isoform X1 [Acipenser oxyrinchus oxyrinchus]